MSVVFGCAPDRVDALIKAVLDELDRVKQEGLAEGYIAKLKNAFVVQNQDDRATNYRWLEELVKAYRYGDPVDKILDVTDLVETISTVRLRDTARKAIDTKRFIKAVLLPEDRARR